MGGYAWVTLATNDAYCLGVLVLAHSLRRVDTKHDLVCLITPGVTAKMRETLAEVFSLVQEVNVLDSKDEEKLALLARPELGITFTKLHCWRLTQYEKCVFVDADTLVVRNCDELFEREELSAAPDVGWPDCFNSGVFVFRPSQQTFASLTAFAAAKGSFDGGDQGLLNMYFSDWATKDISKHLPFIYNMCSTATYSYLPAFKQFGEDVRIIHFIGITKPWLQYFDTLTGVVYPPPESSHLQPLLQLWFNIFYEKVHPHLSSSMTGIAGALAQMTLGQPRSAEQVAYEEHMRKQSWEQGQIDYMGRDSFDNIWKKICETLSFAPQRQPTPPKEDTAKDIAEESDAAEPAVKTPTPVEEDANKPAVEADKAPTRSLAREEIPEEKAPVTQATPPAAGEAEEPAVLTTREPSEPTPAAATEDVPAKPAEGPEDAETGSTPAPAPSPAETIAEQCRLAGPAQEATLQDEGFLETGESRPGDLRADATCEKATPEAEPETASPREATQPADAPQAVATSLAKKEEPEDGASGATADVTQPLTIDPSEQHAEVLLAASEVSTVSPVPIQVAEAVLQAEPKESVAGAAAAASGQAIAATVTAVHRPADVAPLETTGRAQVNGSACESERRGDVAVPPEKDLPAVADVPNDVGEKSARAPAPEAPPAAEKKVESSGGATPPRESPAEAKSPERETVASAEETEALLEQLEKTESSDASEIPESPVAEPSPPAAKTTLSVVPSTPTVTEPTPPASPCAETAPETADEKAAKRDLRKSESADGADSEGADKKTAKKTVKKVTKKPKAKPDEATSSASDGAAAATADSSPGKTKRTVKVTKKTSTKTPEAGATPETPPPSPAGGPDVPVPPKRKTKSGAPSGSKGTEGKVAGKKADAEE